MMLHRHWARNKDIDSLDEIRILSDDDISKLCKHLRRPGGVVPDQVNADGNAVPNPGIQVNARVETYLKLTAFFLRHKIRTGGNITPADVTLPLIRALRELREFKSTYTPSDDLPTINDKDWTMESILEYLRFYLGDKKIPLAFVVQTDEAIPTAEPENGYATIQDEMIACAPHFNTVGGARTADRTYLVNREKVWDIIARIARTHDFWTYVKPAQRTHDGRKAYLDLYGHYLGPNNVDNMASLSKSKLIRDVKVDQGITWFLNLCYSYDVHEKNVMKSKTRKFEWLTPFGDQKEGLMLGTEDFPSLRLLQELEVLPLQNDDYNCGIGICAAIAIILRDVVYVDEKNDKLDVVDERSFSKL